jgi:hypothetical protein
VIKNPFEVNMGVELTMKRVREAPVDAFREIVWLTFCRILEQTPQWSGKAVANWNIGVGAPDFSYDPDVGEKLGRYDLALQRGDNEWIEYAKFRNAPKIREIRRDLKVFICNGVEGDTDNGRSSELYLDSLQDPKYWAVKLRQVNQPYETAHESVIHIAEKYLENGFLPMKASGPSLDRYLT